MNLKMPYRNKIQQQKVEWLENELTPNPARHGRPLQIIHSPLGHFRIFFFALTNLKITSFISTFYGRGIYLIPNTAI